jgi:Tfp pilus assembly protein PilX
MKTISRQNGFVLFMTLMILVLMSIAGLALMRAVDNSTLVAGNIGYKQAAIISSNSAIVAATTAMAAEATLTTKDIANGYYATPDGANTTPNVQLDWTGQTTPGDSTDDVDWDGTIAAAPTKAKQVTFSTGSTTDSSGNRAYYVINRLCDDEGSPGGINCATSDSQTAAVGSTKSGAAYGQKPLTVTSQIYYRITVKVVGPKNTVSYAQNFVLR